jgi:RimJ/RimL family protein N-acetyltransferase
VAQAENTPAIPNGVKIRPATLADIKSYRELRLEALRNHPAAFGQDYSTAVARDQEYWIERLRINEEKEALFFAESDNQLIGMTGIFRNLSNRERHSATIWGVYVKPSWRGKRIAEALVYSCLAWAKEQSVIIVKLAVETNNQSAIRCYERCGFRTYGVEPKAAFYKDKFYDACLMALEL